MILEGCCSEDGKSPSNTDSVVIMFDDVDKCIAETVEDIFYTSNLSIVSSRRASSKRLKRLPRVVAELEIAVGCL